MFRWNSKIKILKKALKEWSRKEFGNNKIRLGQLRSQLLYVQQLAPSEDNLAVQAGIQEAIEVVLAQEEMYLHQRSRVNWLNYGDSNSSFFHASMIQKRQRNQILRLRAANGDWKDTDDKLNHTNIILVPKVLHPEALPQFRPISLCNFSVKIISKVMANLLKKILNEIISPHQSAFVPGQQIQDNIVVAHEAFHFLKGHRRGKHSYAAIKLDLSKAYDRVQWDFVAEVMQAMGFDERWIHWVLQIVTTVSYSVTANGKERFSFLPQRGLRQGDPLSPYLFLLVIDVLSATIRSGARNNLFFGIIMKRGCPLLSHLLFADDALLFSSTDSRSISHIKALLDQFCLASGQLINFDKSSVCFSSNTTSTTKRDLCAHLQIPLMDMDAKYLGLPFFWGRSKTEAYSYLNERALTKMQGWKSKRLNSVGREVMLKHVVQAIPCYAMSCFLLSRSFCKKLNHNIRKFFWSGSPEDMKIHWVGGDEFCKAKSHGGLGFRDLRCFNMSLLAK
ncbi:hypothetical protein RHMOL_Rhmol03G0132800 [Rhododendron molle]|uniref:Uncharacterized protein n=1 Tax=Rhododendron molle TaxID=49168 RepID=A0ACC0PE84_RHOML|nr:hypothetical protein RHMOL_Rhmol03G0132800 [Rhododendron molle]